MARLLDPETSQCSADPCLSGAPGGPCRGTGRDGVLWYYRQPAQRFAARGFPVAGELDREVGEIERLAAVI
ncbi:MAG: hypothetical protein ACREPZ_00240 [Rhodanobacteraceae bacterium]